MGLTRKIASTMTAGAVDFRSDKERIARKTAKSARYEKKSYKLAKAQADEERKEARAAQAAASAPAERQGLFGKMRANAEAAMYEKASPEIRAEMDRQAAEREAALWIEGSAPTLDLVEGLERLNALREAGALSDAEFEAAKARLLDQE